MKITQAPIESLLIIEPRIFQDERGSFFETWNEYLFRNNGLDIKFLQDNQSVSHKGVLRGLHFQNPPFEQGKLVRVIKGSVLDVAVDLRQGSNTYGKHFAIELTGDSEWRNNPAIIKQINAKYIPALIISKNDMV